MENNKLIEALVKAQLEIKAPAKDKVNPRFKTAYSSIDAIYSAVNEPLAAHGLKITHTVEMVDGKPWLLTTLLHVSGEKLESRLMMFVEAQTSQGFASALTYSKRSGVSMLLALSSDTDDDGEVATQEQVQAKFVGLNLDQQTEIEQWIDGDKELMNRILTGYKVKGLAEIAGGEFRAIVNRLEQRRKQ
jgi:hypothetical protein